MIIYLIIFNYIKLLFSKEPYNYNAYAISNRFSNNQIKYYAYNIII